MTASAGDTSFPSEIATRKAQLRSLLRRRRRAIPRRQRQRAAERAAKHLLRLLRDRRHVAVYLSVTSEISTAPMISALLRRGCHVYAPITRRNGGLLFVPLHAHTLLLRGPLGLPQPASRRGARMISALDALVMPLLGFDARGRRLGNGGGFYDRTIAARSAGRRPRRIGLAFASQEVDSLPTEAWDVSLHHVVTERGIIRCTSEKSIE